MDYDFSGLCFDQLEKLTKRLESLNKANMRQYKLALEVINNPKAIDNLGSTLIEVEDHLRDVVKKVEVIYTEALNKVQRTLAKHL